MIEVVKNNLIFSRKGIEDSFGDEEEQGNGALIFDDNALDILDDEE